MAAKVEEAYSERTEKTKSDDDLVASWESLNDQLRNLGIKLLPLE